MTILRLFNVTILLATVILVWPAESQRPPVSARPAVEARPPVTARPPVGTAGIGGEPGSGASAGPVIFYTDIVAGPKTGGEDNNGTYLTIFGLGFGTVRGTSTVKINGVEVATYKQWGAQSRVFDSHGIRMITVQPGSAISTGPVVVTVDGQNSNTEHVFTVITGDIYFVSLTGNDATGVIGDITQPFRSVQTTYDRSDFGPGDTIVMRGGTWEEAGRSSNFLALDPKDGTPEGPMALLGYPGETVSINQTSTARVRIRWLSGFGSWLTVSNLSLNLGGQNIQGFYSNFFAHDVRIVNNETRNLHHTGGGTGTFSGTWNTSKIFGNQVHDVGDDKLFHGIYIQSNTSVGVDDLEIAWNHVYDINTQDAGRGIQLFDSGAGLLEMRNVSIHDNVIHDIHRHAITFSALTATGMKAYNNVIYNTGSASASDDQSGIQFNDCDLVVEVYNNNGYNNLRGLYHFSCATTVTIRNNINQVSSGQTYYKESASWSGSRPNSHNLFFGAGAIPSWADAPTSLNADPQYVDPTAPARDFHLQSPSPAIHAGTTVSVVTRDRDGIIRPQGSAYDMGAYEQ